MAIIINLDELMNKNGYTLTGLAEEVGITLPNLSNIKTGKAFPSKDTLDNLCRVLKCQPGDILEYRLQEKGKVIPLFLDYSGTTDYLLNGGAENVKKFFDSVISMQNKSNCEVQITMVTGSAYESAKSKYTLLHQLAENYGLPELFSGAVAEYCGFLINKEGSQSLLPLDTRILAKRSEIASIASKYDSQGIISPSTTSLYNLQFETISREDLAKVSMEIDSLINDPEIETLTYFDEYGKECDVKPKNHTKAQAVYMVVNQLREKYDVPFVVIGGDSQEEDLRMYTLNKERLGSLGLESIFIAPKNIGEFANNDKNIIVGDWENSDGIADCIRRLTTRMEVKEDGGIQI